MNGSRICFLVNKIRFFINGAWKETIYSMHTKSEQVTYVTCVTVWASKEAQRSSYTQFKKHHPSLTNKSSSCEHILLQTVSHIINKYTH
jgi:hypothetical protein